MLLSHKHMTLLNFGRYLPIKDKTIALSQKGNKDTSSSGSSIECFCAPIFKIKRIIYINWAQGDMMWKIGNAPGQVICVTFGNLRSKNVMMYLHHVLDS